MEPWKTSKGGVKLRQDTKPKKETPHWLKKYILQKKRKVLEGFAYENRRDLTPAEKAMEKILIELGWRFNIEHARHEQRIIVDFFVAEYKLVIEVDGPYHLSHQAKDRMRDKTLIGQGIAVQRFTNEQVLQFPRKTRATLLAKVMNFECR